MQRISIGNPRHLTTKLHAGEGCPPRIVASIGLSPDHANVEVELEKARAAVAAGADIINDDSILEPTGTRLLESLISEFAVPVNTEPVFDTIATARLNGDPFRFSVANIVDTVRKHAELGIDIVTIHLAFSRSLAIRAASSKRQIPITSRGGSLLLTHMNRANTENPYRLAFNEVLAILKEYNLTLSLGTVLRPASIVDGLDELFWAELYEQVQFVEAATAMGIPTMLEGPGHLPLDDVSLCVRSMKRIGLGVPVRLLGPTVCDCAVGYDHIVGCIGATVAIQSGCDFLTCTPRSEHTGLPSKEHIEDAVRTYKVAEYVVKGASDSAYARDIATSHARATCDWEGIAANSLFPSMARELHSSLNPREAGPCSVCGHYCPLVLTPAGLREISKSG